MTLRKQKSKIRIKYLRDRDAVDVESSRRGICEVAGNPFDKHRAPIHPE